MKEPGPPCCGNIVLIDPVLMDTVPIDTVLTDAELTGTVLTDNGPDGCDR